MASKENYVKQRINYAIDAIMLVAFALCAITGVAKMPELGLAIGPAFYNGLSIVHDWSGVLASALALAHLALHARWLTTMTKRAFGRKRSVAAAPASPATARAPLPLTPERAAVRSKGAAVSLILAALLLAWPSEGAWADRRGGSASSATVPQRIDYPAGSLKDGVYEGTANGYMPGLTVRVEVKGGSIGSVTVIKNSESPRWWNVVSGRVPKEIVAAQSTDVDTVSGATCSSYGIMSAVEAALKKAAAGA